MDLAGIILEHWLVLPPRQDFSERLWPSCEFGKKLNLSDIMMVICYGSLNLVQFVLPEKP